MTAKRPARPRPLYVCRLGPAPNGGVSDVILRDTRLAPRTRLLYAVLATTSEDWVTEPILMDYLNATAAGVEADLAELAKYRYIARHRLGQHDEIWLCDNVREATR